MAGARQLTCVGLHAASCMHAVRLCMQRMCTGCSCARAHACHAPEPAVDVAWLAHMLWSVQRACGARGRASSGADESAAGLNACSGHRFMCMWLHGAGALCGMDQLDKSKP